MSGCARFVVAVWNEEEGFLSFEWTLLGVLVVIGIVAGLTAARDAFIDEMSDSAEAILNFDQSYTFAGVPALGIPGSSYTDVIPTVTDCNRSTLPGQPDGDDNDS